MEEEDWRTFPAGVFLALQSFHHSHSEDTRLLARMCGERKGRKANSMLRARKSLIKDHSLVLYKTLFEAMFTYFY